MLILGLRSSKKRSLLDVNEHFESERNDKVALLDSFISFILHYYSVLPSGAILEWIAHAKVKRHILPLEIMYPTLSNRVTWIVELKTEVDT